MIELNFLTVKYPHVDFFGDFYKDEYCVIDSRVHGLFACFYCILYGLFICEEETFKPIVVLGDRHLYYDKQYGDNIFNYFYKQDDINIEQLPRMTVWAPSVFLSWCRISMKEKRMSNYFIKKYFILSDEISGVIRHFLENNFTGRSILGVHYRGRDKAKEFPISEFVEYEEKIDYGLSRRIFDRFFFSTDELYLRDYVKRKYGEKVILYSLSAEYDQSNSKLDDVGLHFSTNTPYLHAKDALIECYLLSECQLLLSSCKSSMSLFATFFNPDLFHIVIEP